jgi:hypothetical protein
VYNYWLSIRRNREFPPIHDLDPIEISDVGPFSLLLEMIGGGEDAEIRHLGQAVGAGIEADKISEAPNPSLLSCIASRLPVVAACRDAFAFEDEFESAGGKTRCWVTLLPFSGTGTWIDFVYGFVSLKAPANAAEIAADAEEPGPVESGEIESAIETPAEPAEPVAESVEEAAEAETEAVAELDEAEPEPGPEPETEPAPEPRASGGKAGFSGKFFESLASVKGFYGRSVEMDELEPVAEETDEAAAVETADETAAADAADEIAAADAPNETTAADEPGEPVADDEPIQPVSTPEGTLHSKLTEVRAKADEARQAKLRANQALYEGLGAAYDFALDAEESPEEYLKLVEAQGLKIQLRSPMKPVAKLAFDGMCDDIAIKQLEAILAWAFDEELPRGTLAERIESEGGIAAILSGQAKAA